MAAADPLSTSVPAATSIIVVAAVFGVGARRCACHDFKWFERHDIYRDLQKPPAAESALDLFADRHRTVHGWRLDARGRQAY